MRYNVLEKSADTLKVALHGSFTFRDHDVFFEIVGIIRTHSFANVIFEMADVNFIDSAAMGMLVIAHEEMVKRCAKVQTTLLNVTHGLTSVADVLYAARMDALYKIVPIEHKEKTTLTPKAKTLTRKRTIKKSVPRKKKTKQVSPRSVSVLPSRDKGSAKARKTNKQTKSKTVRKGEKRWLVSQLKIVLKKFRIGSIWS